MRCGGAAAVRPPGPLGLAPGHAGYRRYSPATLAAVGVGGCALGGVGCRKVLPIGQIRPLAVRSRVLRPDAFGVTSISARTADIAAVLPTQSVLWKLFCQHLSWFGGAWPISVSSSEMILFHRKFSLFARDGYPFQRVIQYSIETSIQYDKWRRTMGIDAVCLYLVAWLRLRRLRKTPTGLQNVPRHLLVEILTNLETVERAGQRRVCRAFDMLFSTTTEIRLNYRQCSKCRLPLHCSCSGPHRHYPFYAPLLKCVTPTTRRITLTNAGPDLLPSVLHTVRVCGQLGQCVAGRPVLVVAAQCHMGTKRLWLNVEDLARSMAGGWCQLRLTRCMIDHPPGICLNGSLQGSSLQEQLCKLIDSGLPTFDAQRTREWTARTVQGDVSSARDDLVEDLNTFTSEDPRKDIVYAGWKWTDGNVTALDVSGSVRSESACAPATQPL